MKLRHLLPLLLVCGFLISGVNKAAAQASIKVSLPALGNQNFWNITLTSKTTSQQYSFNTNNSTYPSAVVGTVPEDIYDIYIQGDYNGSQFAYDIANDAYHDFQWSSNLVFFAEIPIVEPT